MSLLIVSCSLHHSSKSRKLVHVIRDHYAQEEHKCQFVDLAEIELPHCDGDQAFRHPHVKKMQKQVEQAEAIILAVPIYNFGVSSVAKNFIELVGESLQGKVCGFICSAGGQRSYMSVMQLANSLMLDFRCLIVPKFVYLSDSDGAHDSPEMHKRLHELLTIIVALKEAWKSCS